MGEDGSELFVVHDVEKPGGNGNGGVSGVATSGKSIRGEVVDEVDLGEGKIGFEAKIFDNLIITMVRFFSDGFGTSHEKGEFARNKVLNENIGESYNEDKNKGCKVACKKKIKIADKADEKHEAKNNKNGVAFIGRNLFFHDN